MGEYLKNQYLKQAIKDTSLTDLIYLWCDGNDPKFIQKRKYWQKNEKSPQNKQSCDKCLWIQILEHNFLDKP